MLPKVHQVLHGYSDGHRMISGSLSLSSAEARMMVVMSDLSGAGVRPQPQGYLTGYPLEGTGRYVLARTWSAPEMPRPGCVWTHSLIIENADLARMKSADDLLAAFRRPDGMASKSNYAAPLALRPTALRPPRAHGHRARNLLNALYAAPGDPILAAAEDSSEDETLLMATWMQQWPRLRRAFGFCTLAGMDRSAKGVRLDVQLVPDLDRNARAKFPGAVLPQDVGFERALGPLLLDLEGRDVTRLREFLRRAGGDVDGGRRAMLPLCRLHASLFSDGAPDLNMAVTALAELDSLGPLQARSVRAMVVRRAIEDIDELDDSVFDFVLDAVAESATSEPTPGIDRVAASLWRRSPDRFFAALDAGGALGSDLAEVLASLAAEDLIVGLDASPTLVDRTAASRPDLLQHAGFWKLAAAGEHLLDALDPEQAGAVAIALLEAGNLKAAASVIPHVEPEVLASAVDSASDSPALDAWLKELANYPNRAAAVLASCKIGRRSVLVRLARQMEPDAIPNDYGPDPWLLAARAASGSLNQIDEDYFAAFIMSRALGFRSQSPADLVRLCYTTVYRALEQSRLPHDVEHLVIWRLGWGRWFGWDKCSRLRETVVDLFVDRHLDPATFGRLTDDGGLATSLIDEAARSSRGRRYLAEVRKHLKDDKERGIRARANYIARKIK